MLIPSESMKKSLAVAVESYHNQLSESPGEAYLEGRGLTTKTMDYFQIGWVGEPVRGDDHLRGRISIPYLTPTGAVELKFRAIDDTEPKFIYRAGGTARRIYNATILQFPYPTIYVAEGEPDTWTAHQCKLPTVGIPGVKQWLPLFRRIFRNRRVVVLADGDDNGEGLEFAKQVLASVDDCGIILFEGEDVNSFFRKYGEDELRRKVLGD